MTAPPPMQLDYVTPDATPRKQIFSVTAFLVTAFVVLFFYGTIFLLIPKIETIYKDFGTKLPGITQLVLDIARWGMNARFGLIPLAAAAPFVLGFLAPLIAPHQPAIDPRRHYRRMIVALLTVIAVLVMMLIIILLVLVFPMISLIQNISGK